MASKTSPGPAAECAVRLLSACTDLDIRHFAGVPCSYLEALFHLLESQSYAAYYPAPREDVALAFASGCYLAGKGAAVVLQNSGLGHLVNPLTSLNLVYSLPVLMVIGWRGEKPDEDAPEHRYMGPATIGLLETFGIACKILDKDNIEQVVKASAVELRRNRPAAILVPKGVMSGSLR